MCTPSFASLLKSGPGDEPKQEGVSHWKRGSVRCFQSLGQIVEIGTEAGVIPLLFSLGRKQTCESFPPPPPTMCTCRKGLWVKDSCLSQHGPRARSPSSLERTASGLFLPQQDTHTRTHTQSRSEPAVVKAFGPYSLTLN